MNPEKIKTWADNWNDVIRTVLFPDKKLKDLLLMPVSEQGNIMKFITEYFIRYPSTDEVLENHKVRVIYDQTRGDPLNIPQARQSYLEFDIFVKSDVLHGVETDQMKDRAILIFERLRYLLTRSTYICNLRFSTVDDYALAARTLGYRRYHAVFSYKKTY